MVLINVRYKFEDKKTLNRGDTISAAFPSILKVVVCKNVRLFFTFFLMQ